MANGYVLLVPSSVSTAAGTATVSATGKITMTNSTRTYVDGVFSSTYRSYVVFVQGEANTSHVITWRLRNAGSTETSANYQHQRIEVSATSYTAGRGTSDTKAYCGYFNAGSSNLTVMHINSPQHAEPTSLTNFAGRSGSGGRIHDYFAIYNSTSTYDGFTIGDAVNTITGTMTIYGLTV